MKEKRTISKMVSKNKRIDVKVQEFVGVAGDVKYILKECSHCSTVIFAKQEISLTQNKSAYFCKIVFFRCNNWVPERSSNYARHPEKQQQQN